MFAKIINRLCGKKAVPTVIPQQPIVRKITSNMQPISIERMEWLRSRKKVLEPMINTLKLYVNSGSAGVNNTQITNALIQAQTEMLLIHTECQVLEEFFSKKNAVNDTPLIDR